MEPHRASVSLQRHVAFGEHSTGCFRLWASTRNVVSKVRTVCVYGTTLLAPSLHPTNTDMFPDSQRSCCFNFSSDRCIRSIASSPGLEAELELQKNPTVLPLSNARRVVKEDRPSA